MLQLSNNNISQIEGDALAPLYSLAVLVLEGNHLQHLKFKTFISLHTTATHIQLSGLLPLLFPTSIIRCSNSMLINLNLSWLLSQVTRGAVTASCIVSSVRSSTFDTSTSMTTVMWRAGTRLSWRGPPWPGWTVSFVWQKQPLCSSSP